MNQDQETRTDVDGLSKATLTRLLWLNLFTSAQCMISQMCLSVAYSFMFNNSIFVFSLLTGIYLMAMGLGVLVVERIEQGTRRWVTILVLNSALGIVLLNPGVVSALFLNEGLGLLLRSRTLNATWLMLPYGILLSVLIGMVSGAELPSFSKLFDAQSDKSHLGLTRVLTSDYLGAFVGTALFAFVLFPRLGLVGTIQMSPIVTWGAVTYVVWRTPEIRDVRFLKPVVVILGVWLWVSLVAGERVVLLLDDLSR